jgi:hypothetical protein
MAEGKKRKITKTKDTTFRVSEREKAHNNGVNVEGRQLELL